MNNETNACDDEKVAEAENESRVKVICDPKRIKILVEPIRRRILRAMREGIEEEGTIRKEMTVPEIARKLGVSAPKCYHHLDLLVEHGFVRVAKVVKKKRTSITYYERTAPGFVSYISIDKVERVEGIKTEPLIKFIDNGFLLNLSEEEKQKAQELIEEFNERSHSIYVELAKRLKGNIPEGKLSDVLRFVSRQLTSQDKKCQKIREQLAKYIQIDIDI
ncbi:MAG: helix-turn-helix domain-containing protein [Asgard group archaeon]|nr:helix-turn-helix domain-containing protein [Asgard group archaeon]